MNTYNSFNVMLDNKNTAANYTIAAVLTMYKIFLQVFMYVSRISLFGCSLRHAELLRRRSLRPVPCSPQKRSCKVGIIRQDDALVVIPVKVLIQKFPQFVPQDRILHYGLEIFPAVKLYLGSVLFRNGQQPPSCSIGDFFLTCAYERNGSYGSLTRSV